MFLLSLIYLVNLSDMSPEMQQNVCDIAIAGFVCYYT